MIMPPLLRKFALTAHVMTSVGLLGAIAAFLILAIVGLTSIDDQMVRTAYVAMDIIAHLLIVPLALLALSTGLIQSLGTTWGLVQHYWVLIKLILTAFATVILMIKLTLISKAAHLAVEPLLHRDLLRVGGLQLLVHAIGGFLVLLVPMVLSIYKPHGRTPYGWRKQREAQSQ